MNLAAQNEGLKWYNDKKKQACRYSKISNVLGVAAGVAVGGQVRRSLRIVMTPLFLPLCACQLARRVQFARK